MTDDLVKMANRYIAEDSIILAARLAKAVEALRLYACACDGGFCHANENFCGWTATAVLAEIKGGKKDE